MSRTRKEKVAFNRLRELMPDFPSGVVDLTGESPDFIVQSGSRRIGVEHTELFRVPEQGQPPLQELESIRERTVDLFRDQLERSSAPPVWVSVFFILHRRIRKNRVRSLASELLDLVLDNIPDVGFVIRFDVNHRWDDLPDEIDSLEVRRLPEIDFFEVSAPDATTVPQLQRTDVERAIASKERLIGKYNARADELWLLITLDSGSMATWFNDRDPSVYEGYSTKFDRVFILWQAIDKLVELKQDDRTP